MKKRFLGILFALPFLAVGLWMLWSISATLYDAWRMQDWQPANAELLSAGYHTRRGDDSDTYEAYASYRYTAGGRVRTGDRVAISGGGDNIGDYQQDMGRRLATQLRAGAPVTVFFDPDDPDSAIIDRRVRWGLLGFKSIFVLVFGGVGAGILYAALRRRSAVAADAAAATDSPWLLNERWQTATVTSGSRGRMWAAWAFAALWNAISAPLPFLIWREVTEKDNHLALIGLLFPVVGAGLIAWAVKQTREWRRFGPAPLTLDPFPGAIGGHVGGTIDLGLPFDSTAQFEMTLTGIRSYVSGSGKNRSRRESAEWQDSRPADAQPGARGTRLLFRFDVPTGLRESDAVREGDSHREWRLNVRAELPGTDLDRDYDIPVYATAATSRALPERAAARAATAASSLAAGRLDERFRAEHAAAGLTLTFPAGRHLGSALGGAIVGGGFAVGGYLLATAAGSLLMGGVFAAVGGFVMLFCLYLLLNSLTVYRDGVDLVSVRRLLGVPIRSRRLPLAGFARFRRDSTFKSQSGGRHIVHYTLYAVGRGGEEIVVGEGFQGTSEADAAADFLARRFGLRTQDEPSLRDSRDDPLAADH